MKKQSTHREGSGHTRSMVCRGLSALVLAAVGAGSASAADFGEYTLHSAMPPVPTEPTDFQSMWDPFALRDPETGGALESAPQSTGGSVRVTAPFDTLPWNGRQVLRDPSGNWLVLVEEGARILLALGGGTAENPYRPRGGDLTVLELVGTADTALVTGRDEAQRASMAFGGDGRLHVVWHDADGLWLITAAAPPAGAADPLRLARREAWSAPRRLVEGACRPGDLQRDAGGEVWISYAQDDQILVRAVSGGDPVAVAGPAAGTRGMERPAGRIRQSERECQDPVMDLAPDGTLWLAFRRDFAVWAARRTPEGAWQTAERVAREYAFNPSLVVAGGKPLIVFHHDGIRRIPLGLGDQLTQRAGGGSHLGYAVLTADGWRTGLLAAPEEIPVFRRGMWAQRGTGRLLPQIEQFGWPALCRDPQGVVWALWMNATRRWVYGARWMGEAFGEVQECRGPFNAPGLAVQAEKHAPAGAGDLGVLLFAAAAGGYDRPLFDRLKIPSLSLAEDREVLFLDSLEVAATEGAAFRLNPMTKPNPGPAVSPRADRRVAWSPAVRKAGDLYVMRYQSPDDIDENTGVQQGFAISRDGVHFEVVDALPAGLLAAEESPPERALAYWRGSPDNKPPAYYENPDRSDPEKKFMRIGFSTEDRGRYWVEYSPDAKTWGGQIPLTATEAMRERATPRFFDAADPERPIRMYSRVYTETGRSWGVIWSRDLLRWSGLEHLLDPDEPYGATAQQSAIGGTAKSYTMRGQIFLDAVAGKGEDEIYGAGVRRAEGLYFCFYWPGAQGRPLKDVGIAVSRDGFNFTRVKNGARTLPVGPPGAWDSGYIFQMSPMLDGEIVRVFYRGTAGRREGSDGFEHNLTEIGVATIRVNGWTYYTPEEGRAMAAVTTIPVEAPAGTRKRLTVNIEGRTGRPEAFGVEVLDAATGAAIKGYGLADCRLPAEDGVAVPVSWTGGVELPQARRLRLRFHLGAPGVRLYSFGFPPVD